MAGLSQHLAMALFNMSLNPVRAAYTPPAGLWLALHTAAPSDSSYGNEASFTGYARQPINSLTSSPVTETVDGDVDISITNGSAVSFPASSSVSSQTITHWAIWDSEAVGDGNVLLSGSLGTPRLIVTGDSVIVSEGSIQILIK